MPAAFPLPQLAAPLPQLIADGIAALPARAEVLRRHDVRHRELGRLVRDAVLAHLVGERAGDGLMAPQGAEPPALALEALTRLRELQSPGGTFRSGDNVDSPPDSAFTINDLAWARRAAADEDVTGRTTGLAELLPALDALLDAAAPALITGGVHTPNHRWEISSALARLWEITGDPACRARAEQWLAEGVDLQRDGMFSERSANYAVHVSVPSLLTLARAFERPDLRDAADAATRVQAALTGPDGRVETLASRRQDQGERFNGGAMLSIFHAHAARTGDGLTARATLRVLPLATTEAALNLVAVGLEDPSALTPLPAACAVPSPEAREVVELQESGLALIDHGTTRAVLHGGTDTAALGRVTSGAASNPTLMRFSAGELEVRELRLSRDFFSLGPMRPTAPLRDASGGSADGPLRFTLHERVAGQYFHPLAPEEMSPEGSYPLEFNGRFAAAMDFSHRQAEEVALETTCTATIHPERTKLRFDFDGPVTALCLLLALDGGTLTGPDLKTDDLGRFVLRPGGRELLDAGEARAELVSSDGSARLGIAARGQLSGPAFYAPGEAFTFLGGTDEPSGTVLLIPASSAEPLELTLRIVPRG